MSPAEQECRATMELVEPTRRAQASRRSLPRGGSFQTGRSRRSKLQLRKAGRALLSTRSMQLVAVAVRGLPARYSRMAFNTASVCACHSALHLCAQLRQMQSKPQSAASLTTSWTRCAASMAATRSIGARMRRGLPTGRNGRSCRPLLQRSMPLPTLLISFHTMCVQCQARNTF